MKNKVELPSTLEPESNINGPRYTHFINTGGSIFTLTEDIGSWAKDNGIDIDPSSPAGMVHYIVSMLKDNITQNKVALPDRISYELKVLDSSYPSLGAQVVIKDDGDMYLYGTLMEFKEGFSNPLRDPKVRKQGIKRIKHLLATEKKRKVSLIGFYLVYDDDDTQEPIEPLQ